VAASVGKSRRLATERSRGLRASANRAPPGSDSDRARGCERRKSRRRLATERSRRLRASANRAPPHGGGASRGVLSSASDDELGRSKAAMREQQAQRK
jgi:hypothetical protein